jgi:hypothetical protein
MLSPASPHATVATIAFDAATSTNPACNPAAAALATATAVRHHLRHDARKHQQLCGQHHQRSRQRRLLQQHVRCAGEC